MNTSEIAIIILAAGKGTRMKTDLPKVLMPVAGKSMLEHVTAQTLQIENSQTIAVVGYGKEKVKEVIGDGILYVEQGRQLGTGHAVLQTKGFVSASGFETTIVLNGDHPLIDREDIDRLLAKHKEVGAKITLGIVSVESEELLKKSFSGFGRVIRGAEGEIVSIVEKKDCSAEQLLVREVNPNIICCDALWMYEQLENSPKNENTGEYYITSLIPAALAQGLKIQSIDVPTLAGMGANTVEELAVLEEILSSSKKEQ